MSPVSLLLNILWIVCGGIWMAAGWLVAALIMAVTIIGLPWAKAALNIAVYTVLPFGYTVIDKPPGAFGGLFALIGNIVWLVLAGWWLALGHTLTAVALAITIIGLPFAWAHLKLAALALWPVGKIVITVDEAERLRYAPWRARAY